ncbi:RET [Branchiostoma lanceolatum]|uniref:RET protein n=1 Tax=Branchiostoma lanceolatum TaxID=7740 RepID=A0A8K0A8M6_BRALA|nr:RET [Branchiostoma lanceolatum]
MTSWIFCAVLLLPILLPSSQALPDATIWDEHVQIREDVSVGSTVKHLQDFVNASEEKRTPWSVNITRGNEFGRFEVDVENLTVIVAAPLDYEFNPRCNLTLELTNTGDNTVWYVNLAILVMDVSGYPPYYNKRCETPVLPDDGKADDKIVLSSANGLYDVALKGEIIHQYPDILPDFREEAVDAIMENCSLRLCVALTELNYDPEAYRMALEVPENRGRIECQCRDRQFRSKGKFVLLDTSFKDMLPEWAQGGRCDMAEGARYVVLFEGNEIWSTSSWQIQCDAFVTLYATTVPAEFILRYDITGCPDGRFGLYCDKDCVCKNGARCHGFNGACEGEFGHVVRGRLRVPQGYEVLVAAKSIRPDRMTASAVRDFRREMDILARIHEDKEGHPNVVKFYGVLTKSDPQEEYKVTGNRKLLERLGFASGVANGLSELARLKIVHRDIAARNVVISDRKVAKIADFGLSRDVYVSSAYQRTNQGGEEELLPLKWMAVESLRDGVYTCESDVWSYGVLLWEIASFGEEPRYAGGPMHPDVCTMLELLRKGVRLQQPHNCPMSVYKIIRSCWIVDPSKRPTPVELNRKIDQLMPSRHGAHLIINHNI